MVEARRRGEDGANETEIKDEVLGTVRERGRVAEESEGVRRGSGERESEREEIGGESGEEKDGERLRRLRWSGGVKKESGVLVERWIFYSAEVACNIASTS